MWFSSLNEVKELLHNWQALIGSTIGASAPFLLWWLAEKYRERKEKKQYLYYLHRLIVDQINLLAEVEDTARKFLDDKLNALLDNIDKDPVSAYSVPTCFFPLFSVRSLPDDVNKKSSGSGYVDNKVAKVYALSEDFPHIINDIRSQLEHTLEQNEKMAFGKLNSSAAQREELKRNVQGYKEMIEEDLLGKSIPLYFQILAETLVSIKEKESRSSLSWKIKFDPRWKLYTKKKEYLKARECLVSNMDTYFEPMAKDKLKEINKMPDESKK